MNNTEWIVEVDGVKHSIEYKKYSRKEPIVIDGVGRKFTGKGDLFNPFFYEEKIDLGNKEIYFVMSSGKVDLAVDGLLLNSQKEYVRPEKNSMLRKLLWMLVLVPVVLVFLFAKSDYARLAGVCTTFCSAMLIMFNANSVFTSKKRKIQLSVLLIFCEIFTLINWI